MKRSTYIIGSLALNLALLAGMGWMLLKPPPSPVPAVAQPRAPAPLPAPMVTAVTNAPPSQPPIPPFHWSQVESTDYSNYIGNLRRLGCPELTIRRIITGELDELYTQRRQQMLAPWQSQLWDQAARGLRSPLKWMEEMKPVEAELRQNARKLLDEKAQVLQALLGDPPKTPTTEMPSKRYTPEYLQDYLTEEKQHQIMDVEAKFNKMAIDLNRENRGKSSAERAAQRENLNQQKLQAIQAVLTPEEYGEYRLRTSRAASLRYQARNFEAAPEEWRALAQAKMAFDEVNAAPAGGSSGTSQPAAEAAKQRAAQVQAARQNLEEQYQTILGPERYEEFRRSQEGDYQQISRVVERCELPATIAVQAYEIKQSAQTTARTIMENNDLSPDQRQAALEAIRQETQNALNQTLGDRAFQTYSRYGGDWLNNMGNLKAKP